MFRFKNTTKGINLMYFFNLLPIFDFFVSLGMNLASKFLHHIIIRNNNDKSSKLEQFFKSFESVFDEESRGPDGSKSKFKLCSIFKTADGSKAVKEAITLRDTQSLKEILAIECKCHPENSRERNFFTHVSKSVSVYTPKVTFSLLFIAFAASQYVSSCKELCLFYFAHTQDRDLSVSHTINAY